MRPRRLTRVGAPLIAAGLVLAIVVGGRVLARPAHDTADHALGPGTATVELVVHHSRFAPDHLSVRPGTTVRFVIRNEDPINHEFIIGDDGVHRRHEAGTEPVHPPRPGEVSVAAGTTAETTFTFAATTTSGAVLFACHLPGHFRYGMSGTVAIDAA